MRYQEKDITSSWQHRRWRLRHICLSFLLHRPNRYQSRCHRLSLTPHAFTFTTTSRTNNYVESLHRTNSVSNDSITIVSKDFVAYPYHHPRYSGDAIDKATERTMMGSRNEYTAEQQQQHQTQLHSPPPIPLPGIVVRQLTNI